MGGIPYGLIAAVAVAVLAVRHALAAGPSARSKRLVGGFAAASVAATLLLPVPPPAVPLAQVAACVYVLLHPQFAGFDLTSPGPTLPRPPA